MQVTVAPQLSTTHAYEALYHFLSIGPAPPGRGHIFGTPLQESLRYASVQTLATSANGVSYVCGYIPVVIARCGSYLKEKATETEGIFQIRGSDKRMRELRVVFDTPPQYGRNLDWSKETYTMHDIAGVFRGYIAQMREPVVPYNRYDSFRRVLARQPLLPKYEVVDAYKKLILDLPPANKYLLIHVLHLLSVFLRKANKNLMTLTNMAAIFQPGILSHPIHETSPMERALSQSVLAFLISQIHRFPPAVLTPSPQNPIINPAPTNDREPLDMRSDGEETGSVPVQKEFRERIPIKVEDPVRDDQLSSTAMANGEVSEDAIIEEAGVEQSTTTPSRPSEGREEGPLTSPMRRLAGGVGDPQNKVLTCTGDESEASGGTTPEVPKMSVLGNNQPVVADISHEITVVEHDAVGTGGFCDLYVGSHLKHGKVALKRPRFTYAEENVLRRFRKEAKLWCSFDHRCILPFLGVAQVGRHLYLVSPWISRGSLSERLIDEYALDRLLLICDIADALLYLHDLRVVHGDVKCQNVLVNDDGHGLLCDFGLTKILDTMTTSTDVKGAGSTRYMAPELFLDSPKTPASDVYAFAMTIVEIISGKPPFFHIGSNHAVMIEVSLRDGRPLREPTHSKEGTSYERLWRLIDACWTQKQAFRPDMRSVAGALRLLFPATQSDDNAAGQQ